MSLEIIFLIAIFIISVVVHEVSHGYMALMQGDVTAKYAGRLTMNPIKHIDPLGSIIVPLFFLMLPGSFMVGWAKPVPYNPYNLRNKRWGEFLVALAGPLSNLVIAIFFSILIRISEFVYFLQNPDLINFFVLIVFVNIILAFFNLVPIPPLDGSKILFGLLPYRYATEYKNFSDRYSLILFFTFIFFGLKYFSYFLFYMLYVFTGLNM